MPTQLALHFSFSLISHRLDLTLTAVRKIPRCSHRVPCSRALHFFLRTDDIIVLIYPRVKKFYLQTKSLPADKHIISSEVMSSLVHEYRKNIPTKFNFPTFLHFCLIYGRNILVGVLLKAINYQSVKKK